MEKIGKFDWFEFIFGILLFVAAIYLMVYHSITAEGLAVIGVVLLLAAGIKSLWEFHELSKWVGQRSWAMLIAGIIEIIIAIVFMYEFKAAVPTLGILFGLFIVVESAAELFVVSHLRKLNGGIYWGSLVLSLVALFLGILLMFYGTMSAQVFAILFAIVLIIIAINMILLAFAHRYF